jgi:hypothetical protein
LISHQIHNIIPIKSHEFPLNPIISLSIKKLKKPKTKATRDWRGDSPLSSRSFCKGVPLNLGHSTVHWHFHTLLWKITMFEGEKTMFKYVKLNGFKWQSSIAM